MNNVADLGSGTGVNTILASKYKIGGKYVTIDNSEFAVQCTKTNCQIYGLTERLVPLEIDLRDLYQNEALFHKDNISTLSPDLVIQESAQYNALATELGMPTTYDLIFANPPWLPANHLVSANPLDNGVYDPHEEFLKSILNFSRIHLSKGKGKLILVYSDLAEIIGLQDEG